MSSIPMAYGQLQSHWELALPEINSKDEENISIEIENLSAYACVYYVTFAYFTEEQTNRVQTNSTKKNKNLKL